MKPTQVKKLISFSKEEWDFILKYTKENNLKSATEGVRSLAREKMKNEKALLDTFFSNPKTKEILKELSGK